MDKPILSFQVVDQRSHSGGEFQVLFATNDPYEGSTVTRESGGGAALILVGGNERKTVLFINE